MILSLRQAGVVAAATVVLGCLITVDAGLKPVDGRSIHATGSSVMMTSSGIFVVYPIYYHYEQLFIHNLRMEIRGVRIIHKATAYRLIWKNIAASLWYWHPILSGWRSVSGGSIWIDRKISFLGPILGPECGTPTAVGQLRVNPHDPTTIGLLMPTYIGLAYANPRTDRSGRDVGLATYRYPLAHRGEEIEKGYQQHPLLERPSGKRPPYWWAVILFGGGGYMALRGYRSEWIGLGNIGLVFIACGGLMIFCGLALFAW